MDGIGPRLLHHRSLVYSSDYISDAVVSTATVINALILFRISLFSSFHLVLSPRSLDQCLDKELQTIQFSNDPQFVTKGVEVVKKMMVVSLKTSVAISLVSTTAFLIYALQKNFFEDRLSDRLSIALGTIGGCVSGLKMKTHIQAVVRKNLIPHLIKGIPTSQLAGVVCGNLVGVSLAGTSSFLRTAFY
jgi:hypothetical protein